MGTFVDPLGGTVVAPDVITHPGIDGTRGALFQATRNARRFFAGNQAATAISVALATTYTGVCISNPAGSTVYLSIDWVSFALSVAPAAIAPIGVITGYAVAGVVTHTTPLTPACALLGNTATPQAKADAACTIVGTPVWTPPWLQGGFTAAALPSQSDVFCDLKGSIVVPPGGYIAIGALTAVTGFGAIGWEEIPSTSLS